MIKLILIPKPGKIMQNLIALRSDPEVTFVKLSDDGAGASVLIVWKGYPDGTSRACVPPEDLPKTGKMGGRDDKPHRGGMVIPPGTCGPFGAPLGRSMEPTALEDVFPPPPNPLGRPTGRFGSPVLWMIILVLSLFVAAGSWRVHYEHTHPEEMPSRQD